MSRAVRAGLLAWVAPQRARAACRAGGQLLTTPRGSPFTGMIWRPSGFGVLGSGWGTRHENWQARNCEYCNAVTLVSQHSGWLPKEVKTLFKTTKRISVLQYTQRWKSSMTYRVMCHTFYDFLRVVEEEFAERWSFGSFECVQQLLDLSGHPAADRHAWTNTESSRRHRHMQTNNDTQTPTHARLFKHESLLKHTLARSHRQ